MLERAIQLSEAVGDLETLGTAHNNLADGYLRSGELDRARQHLERSLEIRERVGDVGATGFQMVNLGEVLTYLGAWKEADTWVERGRKVISTMGALTMAVFTLSSRAVSARAADVSLARRQIGSARSLWRCSRYS